MVRKYYSMDGVEEGHNTVPRLLAVRPEAEYIEHDDMDRDIFRVGSAVIATPATGTLLNHGYVFDICAETYAGIERTISTLCGVLNLDISDFIEIDSSECLISMED